MLVISDNLSISRKHVATAIEARDADAIKEEVRLITQAGADLIDVNIAAITHDPVGVMTWLVDQVQEASPLRLSLDAHTLDAVIAGAERAKVPPLLNAYYLQSSDPEALSGRLLPYAAANGLEVVLSMMGPSGPPLDPVERLAHASTLVEAALTAGIPANAIWLDPVVVHVGGGFGQEHAAAVLDVMKGIPAVLDPAIRTLAGVEYLSQGAPTALRSAINRVYLAMLAALGLDAAIVDVADAEMMRDIRLVKAFRSESLYSLSDAELR
jgi:5-methyltetrahydrofolate corrinoid/iron sulfur protein methyltransferase